MAETIWTDPESRSEAEHTDSLLKKMSMGVPLHQLWEDAGYSQQQIARFRELLIDERALLRVPFLSDAEARSRVGLDAVADVTPSASV